VETRRLQTPIFELMQQDHNTPEEVAELFEIGLDVVRHAAFTGELPATIVNHDIVSIRREDVLNWFEQRGGPYPSSVADEYD
jgi:hypothetical protein